MAKLEERLPKIQEHHQYHQVVSRAKLGSTAQRCEIKFQNQSTHSPIVLGN